MGSVNKWIGIGNLGHDPEVKYTPQGKAVCELSLACNEVWKDKSGAKQERVEWVRVKVWGDQAEHCGKYLAKGRQVYVEGRLATRSYEDKQGVKKYVTEVIADKVVFLGGGDSAGTGGSPRGEQTGWGGGAGKHSERQASAPLPDHPLGGVGDPDDVPF